MEELEHSLAIVDFVNRLLGKPVASFLALLGIEVKDPAHVIPDYIVMCFIVAIFLVLFLGLASRKRSLVPSKLQSVMEMIKVSAWSVFPRPISSASREKNICP